MKVLVKIDSNLVQNDAILKEIKKRTSLDREVVLIYDANTQISKALGEKGIKYVYNNGEIETSEEGLKTCLEVSDNIRKNLESKLNCTRVIVPVDKINERIYGINISRLLEEIHDSYDRVYIYTKKGEAAEKSKFKNTVVIEVE